MVAWTVALRALVKWGPVVFAAGRKSLPYLKDNPAGQRFLLSLGEQTAALPDRLSAEGRVSRKISAVRQSLAEAATLGIDTQMHAKWRSDLDDLSRTVALSKAAARSQRRNLLRRCDQRLDQLVAEILPSLTSRRDVLP